VLVCRRKILNYDLFSQHLGGDKLKDTSSQRKESIEIDMVRARVMRLQRMLAGTYALLFAFGTLLGFVMVAGFQENLPDKLRVRSLEIVNDEGNVVCRLFGTKKDAD
jgi:hypothetical protein